MDLEWTFLHTPNTHPPTSAPPLGGLCPSYPNGVVLITVPACDPRWPITAAHACRLQVVQRRHVIRAWSITVWVWGFPFRATGEDALKGKMRFWNYLRPWFLLNGRGKKPPKLVCNQREWSQQRTEMRSNYKGGCNTKSPNLESLGPGFHGLVINSSFMLKPVWAFGVCHYNQGLDGYRRFLIENDCYPTAIHLFVIGNSMLLFCNKI